VRQRFFATKGEQFLAFAASYAAIAEAEHSASLQKLLYKITKN